MSIFRLVGILEVVGFLDEEIVSVYSYLREVDIKSFRV